MSLPTFVNNTRSSRVKASDELVTGAAPPRRRNARVSDADTADLRVSDESEPSQERRRNERMRRSIGDAMPQQQAGPKGKRWPGATNGNVMRSAPEFTLPMSRPEASGGSGSSTWPRLSQARGGAKTSIPDLPALSGNKTNGRGVRALS